jgi:REP element-mobilizing transposase RayT
MIVDGLNLPPLPGFRGLDPNLPITMYFRHLPHWRQQGAAYFVTFRLADALPQTKLHELRRWREEWERTHSPPRSEEEWEVFSREYMRRVDAWMDEGYGECVFVRPDLATVMSDAFLFFQNQRYEVFCFVVMPNHCHVVVKPLAGFELEKVLESWKGYVAHEVNRRLKRNGPLWQEESYDRIIRDEEHLFRVIQYIGNNPAKVNLPREQWLRWIHPAWEAIGWGFRDLHKR